MSPLAMIKKEDVEAALKAENAFSIPAVPISQRNMKTVKIFNICTFHPHWTVELGTLGTFHIAQAEEGFLYEPDKDGNYQRRACKDGEIAYSRPCQVPLIVREGHAVDLRKIVHTEWSALPESQDEDPLMKQPGVVNDILGIGPNKSPRQNLTVWGVFLAAGDVPTKAELSKAHAALTKKMQELWAEAQAHFMRGPQGMADISEVHRHADNFLKRRALWNQESQQMESCPGCGELIFSGAAAHIGGNNPCGAVINEEKVIKLRLKGFEHLWKKGA